MRRGKREDVLSCHMPHNHSKRVRARGRLELEKALDSKGVVSSIPKDGEGEAQASRSINRDFDRDEGTGEEEHQ